MVNLKNIEFNIIIIEDNLEIANFLQKRLMDINHKLVNNLLQIEIYHSYENFKRYMETTSLNQIKEYIVDINLGTNSEYDGLKCLELINKSDLAANPIVYTGFAANNIREACFQLGVPTSHFLLKGENIKDNLNRITNLITENIHLRKYKVLEESRSHKTSNLLILPEQNIIVQDLQIINTNLLELISNNPRDIYNLSPRKFEEFIADLFTKEGYTVELTGETRDGGKDMYAYKADLVTNYLYAIECKKYNPLNKVGRPHVQKLLGVVEAERLTGGIIATTSFFTKDAKEFTKGIKNRMALNDFDRIMKLIRKHN